MALATASPDAFLDLIFAQVKTKADTLLATNYPVLAAKVMPIAVLIAMIWVGVKVIRVHSGRDPADVWPLVRMALTIMSIFTGLNWSTGGVAIYHFFTQLRDDTTAIFMGGQSIVQYMDTMHDHFTAIASYLMSASWQNMGIIALGLLMQAIDCLLVVLVLFLEAASYMGLAITTVMGPLFLPTLFWTATRGYGMNWFSAQLKFALVGVILGICVVFSFGIAQELMSDAMGVMKIAPADVTAADVAAAFILQGFMCLFVWFGVKPLASALASSGAAAGGMAEMAGGMLVSSTLTKLFGSGRGAGAGGGIAPTLNSLAQTQTSQGQQLDRIERMLGNQGPASAMQSPPSGAGQPGQNINTAAGEGAKW
jgi:type IV secretion system protein VirB6